ncbi:hypothetical protein SCLCIDRAFT_1212088 [Scleroderma citrinum Foug A]|uniref:Uncharacterized protein n=1 Tax=Scleroderma citrinum Foug A TaxID=1036808 RepID=A0A0C3EBI9_9AGAM|nr:hypothetical protein SCLCIDRAFT_1212088 [Scleroderma citrinum Foug A]
MSYYSSDLSAAETRNHTVQRSLRSCLPRIRLESNYGDLARACTWIILLMHIFVTQKNENLPCHAHWNNIYTCHLTTFYCSCVL